jgi:MFS family permease
MLPRDGKLLFATRCVRLFAYGFLSVVLVLYLAERGLSDAQIGLLLTLTLVGDVAISLWMTTSADRLGRRRMLMAGCILMLFAAVVFVATGNFLLLLLAAIVGVISPTGNEVGPFLAIEQAALSRVASNERRTAVLAWYNLAGSLATALGALLAGVIVQLTLHLGYSKLTGYQTIVLGYGLAGIVLMLLFGGLSPLVDAEPISPDAAPRLLLGLHESRGVVLRLSALFALDAFGGGFVVQSMMAYWFHLRFGADAAQLGRIFFSANLLAGVSSLAAARLARKIGLLNTMVFTHLPSNFLLLLVPLMPTQTWAVIVLLLRFSISQMDVPTRQSYTLAVVHPNERSAAAGVTGVARHVGAAIPPLFTGIMLARPALLAVPFLLAGGIKIAYDLLLLRSFAALKPRE